MEVGDIIVIRLHFQQYVSYIMAKWGKQHGERQRTGNKRQRKPNEYIMAVSILTTIFHKLL